MISHETGENDSPILSNPGPLRRIRQWLRAHAWGTRTGLSLFIAILSVVAVATLLSGRYIFARADIKSDISMRTITAEKFLQVEDTTETQRLRYEARQMMQPHYRRWPDAGKIIMDRLLDALEDVENTREDASITNSTKGTGLARRLGHRQEVPPSIISTLMNTRNWRMFYKTTTETAENLIAHGVSSEDFRVHRDSLVRQAMPMDAKLTPAETDALVFLVADKLRPTLLIDENATEEARNIAADHVKPVIETFNQGDLIVRKGEHITEFQRAVLEKQGSISNRSRWLSVLGVVILTASLLAVVWGYLYRFEHSSFFRPAYCGLLATVITLSIAGVLALEQLQGVFPIGVEYYPIALLSLTICIFTHPRVSILTTLIVLLLCGLVLRIPLDTLSVLVASSLAGVFVLARKPVPSSRNDLILSGLAVGLMQALAIWAISFIYAPTTGSVDMSIWLKFGFAMLSGLAAGCLTLGLLPLFESIFRLVTPYTLLELGTHDRPILKRMQLEAPGTFHHSIMVATLAEAAAEAIGANPILTRVGALYHDIGKIKRPLFFVENQAYFGVENPHDKLTPRLSKMVITAHPRDGIEMGKSLNLPKAIMRFMPEHHGTMVAGYFYNRAVLEEGEENVDKAQFRYPGPKPQSRETAIVMLADACESAVRALKNPTAEQVEDRIDKIIKQRIDDAQFTECSLTFRDVRMIRETFLHVLRGIQHNRIEYQQNMLEELGRKRILDEVKQAARNFSTDIGGEDIIPMAGHVTATGDGTPDDLNAHPRVVASNVTPLTVVMDKPIPPSASLPPIDDETDSGCC